MDGIYGARDRVFQPWKNNGGQTAEILASPVGSGFDTFDWRISTAMVASDGPFSTFPGIDRVLTVLEGGPMVLTIGGGDHRLDQLSPPFAFSGDLPCMARLEGTALLDLNVMVRRPLRAEVVKGPLDPRPAPARARYALLLEDRAGVSRLDLVDLDRAAPDGIAGLAGALAIRVTVLG